MSSLSGSRVVGRRKIVLRAMVAALCNASLMNLAWSAPTVLADQPIRTTINVPANIVFPISVEYPTAISVGYPESFKENTKYDGYFDPAKCYKYDNGNNYFYPVGATQAGYKCVGTWSGTLLNWATMQTIDLFRWVMTGGYRSIDLPKNSGMGGAALTVLQRTYASPQGQNPDTTDCNTSKNCNFPNRTVPAAKAANYSPLAVDVEFKNWGKGLKFTANGTSYYAAVKVCDGVLRESNCTKYGAAYKPEGLIQQNRDSMMFSVFGYLYREDWVEAGHGGVMRARSRHVMATGDQHLGAGIARPGVALYEATEISDTGAFITNPDTVDAAASPGGAEANSGAINYINGFGMLSASHSYMKYDSVSLLYAEALKYLRGLDATPAYLADIPANPAYQDAFAVVSDWKNPSGMTTKDPILRWCQKNFFVGIGDVNTWFDKALSGNAAAPAGVDGHMGSKATADAWTAAVGGLESGMGDLAVRSSLNGDGTGYDYASSSLITPDSCCTGNGNYIAGMAYYANTEDIRPDIAKSADKKTTVRTYWVDVLEFQKYKHRNQYWLATKYGGFVDSNGNGKPDLDTEWQSTTTTPYVLPKTYFPAANAQMLADGLRQAFKQIREDIAEGAGVGVSSPSLTLGSGAAATKLFQVTYDSNGWGGTVKGLTIDAIAADGTLSTTPYFNTDTDLFKAKPADWWKEGKRIIATGHWSGGVFTATPFHWDKLTPAQQTALGSQSVLNYLRGDKSGEGTSFRVRSKPLGDVVNSQAVFLGASTASYTDDYNSGYTGYKSGTASRTPVVFVGSNDGMLHAINANTGLELWAYVPSFTMIDPNIPHTAAVDGLQALSRPDYAHHNYVDATPYIADVDFANTGGSAGSGDWRTLLVGGMGKGGTGYYAIDVSNASAIGTVDDLTSASGAKKAQVLWEFTDVDMGYTYGRPVIVKMAHWGWVVIVTGGYNNTGAGAANPGKGVIYVLNAKTGAVLKKAYTTAGSSSDPSGFAHASAFVPDFADFTALNLYGGDLQGHLWRFDLTNAGGDVPAPTPFASLTDGASPQPVTTEPQVEYEAGSQNRWVFIGTGQLLSANDTPNSQVQTIYAFRDGRKTLAWEDATLPGGLHFPVGREKMVPVSDADLPNGVLLTSDSPMGWYHDLTGIDGAARERIVVNPLAVNGADIMTWMSSIPSTDPCVPGGKSRYYKTAFGSGRSLLLDSGLSPIPFRASDDQVVGYAIVKNAGNTSALITTPTSIKAPKDPVAGTKKPAVNNWRLTGQDS